jgi:chemotaxis response regulator CheB
MRVSILSNNEARTDFLRQVLTRNSSHTLAWTARTGMEAAVLSRQQPVDAVLFCLEINASDAAAVTREVMAASPGAVLLVTENTVRDSQCICEAMGAGALDVVDFSHAAPVDAAPLLAKLDMIARLLGVGTSRSAAAQPATASSRPGDLPLVVIGSSAGGPAALASVLGGLSPDFPGSIILVQHVDQEFAPSMAGWLDQQSRLSVRLAREGDVPTAGQVYLAGKNDHLILREDLTLGYTPNPRDCVYRPSVDAMFGSVARHWKGRAVGVLLTGMGGDGARGLKALRDRGYHTIAQSQATCSVYGMPKAAVQLNAAVEVLSLDKIAACIERRCCGRFPPVT